MSQSETLQTHLTHIMHQLQLEDSPAGGSVVVYHQNQIVAEVSVGDYQPLTNTSDIQTDSLLTGSGLVTDNNQDQQSTAQPHNRNCHETFHPWTAQTLSLNFSTGKGVLVTLIHVLVSKNLLDYDTPIASYWSAFGQAGKQDITLRQVLTHTAGLFDIQSITTCGADMFDWALMLSRVENMPIAQPKNQQASSCYSALVSGWVLGGLIEKVTRQRLNEALDTFLTEPLGLTGQMRFGIGANRLSQVATPLITSKHGKSKHSKPRHRQDSEAALQCYAKLPSYGCWQHAFQQLPQYEPSAKAVNNTNLTTADINGLYLDLSTIDMTDYRRAMMPTDAPRFDYYTEEALTSVMPAVNVIASAKGLAVMYAMLANKGVWQDNMVICPEVFAQINQIYVQGGDAIMPASYPTHEPSMQWRLGYHKVFSRCHDVSAGFGHMGYDGSVAWCDPSRQLAMAYVHNYPSIMTNDIRQFALTEAVLEWFDDR